MSVRPLGSFNSPGTADNKLGYLHLDDPRIGVVYGSTADQGDKIQAAFDLAASTGETVFVGGTVYCNRELVWPTTRYFRLLGAGAGDYLNNAPAAIVWPDDLGVRTFGIRVPVESQAYSIESITLVGPGSGGTAIGTMPCQMYGFYASTRGIMREVAIRGFGAGIGLINDHQEFHSCDFRGNGYGIDHMDNPLGGLGDLLFDRCYITDQTCASVAVASTNAIANARYTQGHMGATPFGIYRYQALVPATGGTGSNVLSGVNVAYTPQVGMTVRGPQSSAGVDSTAPVPAGTTITGVGGSPGAWSITLSVTPTGPVTQVELGRRGTVVVGVVFENWSFEYCGNAMFYDEVGDNGGWANIVFDMPAEFGTGGSAKWPGKPWPMAKIQIDNGDGIWARGGPLVAQSDAPLQPLVSAKDLTNFKVDDPRNIFDGIMDSNHKTFTLRSGGVGAKYVGMQLGSLYAADGLLLGGIEAAEDITKGSLVEMYGSNQVRESRNSVTSQVVGVSLINYSAGDVCVFVRSGTRTGFVVRNSSGSTITNGSLIVPDSAHQGCVKVAADITERTVGRLHDGSITSGATGPAEIRL